MRRMDDDELYNFDPVIPGFFTLLLAKLFGDRSYYIEEGIRYEFVTWRGVVYMISRRPG